MKKVLVLFIDLFEKRGIQRYNQYLCDALETQFSEITFIGISLSDPQRYSTKGCWRNIEIKFCGRYNSKLLQKIVFVFKTIITVLTQKPEFLICAHVNLSPTALFFKRIFGLKYAVLTHGVDCWNLERGIKYAGLKNADIITTVSEYSKQRMIMHGISEDKIELLHPTVDEFLFYQKPVNRELINQLVIENKRVLLTVAKVDSRERYKGHDVMLEVLKELGDGYVWLVVSDGDDLPRLRQKAKDLDIIKRIRFAGKVTHERLVDYYNLCDVFVMPSTGEGFGMVFLEAMACGKPVIGGNKDGSVEPLMSGKLGLLIDPDNVEAIKKAIIATCANKEKGIDLNYLRVEVEKNFGIKVFNRRTKEIFTERFR